MSTGSVERINWNKLKKSVIKHRYLYIMALPVILYFFIFSYIPMYGVIIAFQRFSPGLGIWGSEFIGLANFTDFFGSFYFFRLMRNTLLISFFDILFSFPAPIFLALLLNEVKSTKFKRTVQTVTYMPHFISLVVVCGLIRDFSIQNGVLSEIVYFFTGNKVNLLGRPEYFRPLFVGSNIWQHIGFGSIIFLAAISAIDQEMYEAAIIDGASRLRQTWHITLPSISSTIIILLILRIGNTLNVSAEKIILLYSPITYETADVISSFVYRVGLLENNFSYSAAVGLFNSVVNFIMLITANQLSRKVSESSLW